MTRRLILTLLGAVALLCPMTRQASAGDYTVLACDAAPDGAANNAWLFNETAVGRLEHGDGCSADAGAEVAGLFIRDDLTQSSNIPAGTSAYWTFTAPAGTAVAALSYSRHLRTYLDEGWQSELRADTAVLEHCVVPATGDECDLGQAGGGPPVAFTSLDTSKLEVGARCAPVSPATTCTHGASLNRVLAALYSAQVTVRDPSGPSVGTLGGGLTSAGWLRGPQSASVTAQDASGIDRLELLRDGSRVLVDDRDCDYTLPAPCSSPGAPTSAAWTTVDTSTWSDGTHQVLARASDAADNETSTATIIVRTDNTPPAPPTPAADAAWSAASDASWTWTVPAESDRAPIDRIEYETCRDTACSTATTSPEAKVVTVHETVGEGTTSLRARHRDAAGNVGEWSTGVVVRRDRTPPAAPQLQAPKRAPDRSFRIPVAVTDPGPAPIRRLAGTSCQVGGTCDALRSTSLSDVSTERLAPGRWVVQVHAVDEAGNVGADAQTQIRVPRLSAKLTLVRARVTRRHVKIIGKLARAATGRARIILVSGRRSRKRVVAVHDGVVRGALPRLHSRTGRLRIRVRYLGDATYAPATRSRTLRPAASHRGRGEDPLTPPPLGQL